MLELKSQKELLIYSYRVAGTVGLMMAKILNVKSQVAFKSAMDLGIAMQLTNICRDIKDDAEIGRIYLPKTMVNDLSIKNFKNPSVGDKKVVESLGRAAIRANEIGVFCVFFVIFLHFVG